jgi:hypothetical protein
MSLRHDRRRLLEAYDSPHRNVPVTTLLDTLRSMASSSPDEVNAADAIAAGLAWSLITELGSAHPDILDIVNAELPTSTTS